MPGTPAGGNGYGPPRGYSWEPFALGNEAHLSHGASKKAKRLLSPIAEALVEQLRQQAPWTAYPAFQYSVQAWAWAEARCVRYRLWAEDHDLIANGKSPGWIREWDKAESRAQSLRSALGLDPTALSKLLARASSRMSKAVAGDDQDLLVALEAAGATVLNAEVQGRQRAVEAAPVVDAEE
jgi:hypothetical protein